MLDGIQTSEQTRSRKRNEDNCTATHFIVTSFMLKLIQDEDHKGSKIL